MPNRVPFQKYAFGTLRAPDFTSLGLLRQLGRATCPGFDREAASHGLLYACISRKQLSGSGQTTRAHMPHFRLLRLSAGQLGQLSCQTLQDLSEETTEMTQHQQPGCNEQNLIARAAATPRNPSLEPGLSPCKNDCGSRKVSRLRFSICCMAPWHALKLE